MAVQFLSWVGNLGAKTQAALIELSRMRDLAASFLYWSLVAPFAGKRGLRRESFAHQLCFMGNQSLFIIFLVSASVGAVLALQAAYQLKQFGALLYTGALVSVSMSRELGPIVTAIVVAGRVGASITAELGTMKVSEEVDALTTMGIPPVPYLVVPRILAMLVMLPCLTVLSFAIGIFGGYLIGVVSLGIDANLYLKASFDALASKDILTGVAKSFVFALLVGIIATYSGLAVEGGAEGVGKATTRSVVASIIAIIVADGICTAVFFYVFP
ncbi:MAG: ABC transporter permease [Candidatus Omnitrophota bacterium]|jgi:phospholipid/cholesterol/gamma-HCH transport system permease protein